MKIYKLLLTLLILVVFSVPYKLLAQSRRGYPYRSNTSAYVHWLSKYFGITVKIPQNFTDLHKYYIARTIRKDSQEVVHTGDNFGPIFQTSDKECVIMYGEQPIYMTKEDKELAKHMVLFNRGLNGNMSTAVPTPSTYRFTRGQIIGEIEANEGIPNYTSTGKPRTDSVHFHFNKHVTLIAGKIAKERFNADTLYIYDLPIHNIDPLPLPKSNHEKYIYRTGLALEKKGRGSMLFMLFFTSKGKENEWKYINMLNKNVWYDEDFKQGEHDKDFK